MKITMKQILNWIQMSNLKVQKSSIKLLIGLFMKRFQNYVVQLKSESSNEVSHGNHYLELRPTNGDCRTILLLMQNILIQKNAFLDEEVLSCITSMLSYLHATDTFLEQHLLMQPWTKVVLNVRLNRENLQEADSRIIQLFLIVSLKSNY
ncbi:uncharacterized protein LOC143239839 [Tachypleus tridentatus]|uniref:uncharacterized protein LOC143239839 n=1 Tax=Tachypleus tridentatus TaxID=6853 RepID=UPI003FD40646